MDHLIKEEPVMVEVEPLMLVFKEEPLDSEDESCDSPFPDLYDTHAKDPMNSEVLMPHAIAETFQTIPKDGRTTERAVISFSGSDDSCIAENFPSALGDHLNFDFTKSAGTIVPIVKVEAPQMLVDCPEFIGPDNSMDGTDSPPRAVQPHRLQGIKIEYLSTGQPPRRDFNPVASAEIKAPLEFQFVKPKSLSGPYSERERTFSIRGQENDDERLRAGDRRFPCRYCPKVFAGGAGRRKHERWHEKRNEERSPSEMVTNLKGVASSSGSGRLWGAQRRAVLDGAEDKMIEPLFPCRTEDEFIAGSIRCLLPGFVNSGQVIHPLEPPKPATFACNECGKSVSLENATDERPCYKCADCEKAFQSSSSSSSTTDESGEDQLWDPRRRDGGSPEIASTAEEITVEPLFPGEAADDDKPTGSEKPSDDDQLSPSKSRPFACKFCGKTFKKKNITVIHERTHTGERPYKCAHCAKTFISSSNKIKHEQIHMDEKPYACAYCDKTFSQNNQKIQHERTHTGEKPYACQFCDKFFCSTTLKIYHERTHTGERPFKCAYCDKAFLRNSYKVLHERTHTGEKPFLCKYCKKPFSQNSHRGKHERTHKREKPFRCTYCKKTFSKDVRMVEHERSSSGENRYACQFCDNYFSMKKKIITIEGRDS